MAKFLNKTARKPARKKHGFMWFLIIYSALFIIAAGIFLNWFWGFMEGYELSRPQVAIDAYMNELTREHIAESAADLIAGIDHSIQSEEACKEAVMASMGKELTYARKSSECTDTRQVYVLRSGAQVIGSFTMVPGEADSYGFTPWIVAEEAFDFSFLLGEKVSVQAPLGYPVTLNGVELDDRYVTGTESIPFDLFKEFYKKYELPEFTKVTYEAGPFLGQPEMQVTTPDGTPFTLDENTDLDAFTDNCTELEIQELSAFLKEFLHWYVVFTGCANDAAEANYARLSRYVVPDSDLDERLLSALDGLQYAQSKGDTIADISTRHYVSIGDNRYLVDLTYLVDTIGTKGTVQTSTDAKLIILRTENGMKTEMILTY